MNYERNRISEDDAQEADVITAQVSLPAAVWERLTANLRDDDRIVSGDDHAPDTSLPDRIDMFLDMKRAEWEWDVADKSMFDNDLDDDVPF